MGLGALNEMIEFAAVVMFPQTNVGGYVNTALDPVFNAAGAVVAMALIAVFSPPARPPASAARCRESPDHRPWQSRTLLWHKDVCGGAFRW
jgi:hypothetical protein